MLYTKLKGNPLAKKPEKPKPTPLCCGQHSVWVDYGPRLRYYYCRKCKKELNDKPPASTIKDDYWYGYSKEELNEAIANAYVYLGYK